MGEFLREHDSMLQNVPQRKRTRGLNCMRIDRVVGSGTFGVVYKAQDKSQPTETMVALKKIRMERETQGFPVTAIREIKILKQMKHDNIVLLREIVTYDERDEENEPSLLGKDLSAGDVFMVFEYVDYDLAGLLKSQKFQLTPAIIKSYAHQLLKGVEYLHEKKILHRDIKTANLLVTKNNVLKIADWGLARNFQSPAQHKLTVPVVTLWYRSPELILGANVYGPEVDMWSVGCVFGELNTRVAMFRGEPEPVQLENIFSLLGAPAGATLEKYKTYPHWDKMNPNKPLYPRVASKMTPFFEKESASTGLALLLRMLELNPTTRITAQEALGHDFFSQGSALKNPGELPPLRFESVTEYLVQQERANAPQGANNNNSRAVLPPKPQNNAPGVPVAQPHPHSNPQPSHHIASQQARKMEQMRKHRELNPQLNKFSARKPVGAAQSSTSAIAPSQSSSSAASSGVAGASSAAGAARQIEEPQAKKMRLNEKPV